MTTTITYTQSPLAELSPRDRELVEAAREAARAAHAPFTKFRVGAAARLENGETITSSNFEGPIGTLSICAERRLLYAANGKVETLAMASPDSLSECYPCGVCRQAMMEHNPRMRVIMAGEKTATIIGNAADLLPFSYSYEDTLRG